MALMVSLSSYSSITAIKPQSSSSSCHSQNKPFSTLHCSRSLLQADLIGDSCSCRRLPTRFRAKLSPVSRSAVIAAAMKTEPLRIMISGAPASGKGTQCELITKKYGLVHIAAGDLLRAEIAAGSENGKRAKEYMEKGMLVPDEIVVMMVKERLLQPDAQENGWLLDGYPRSLSQAKALEDLGIRPDLFILLDVSEDILVERVVGRRLDPVTGKIYHLKYSPPENEEIASRLTQRFDDTEEKVKLRLQTYHQNVDAVLFVYKDVTYKIWMQIGSSMSFLWVSHSGALGFKNLFALEWEWYWSSAICRFLLCEVHSQLYSVVPDVVYEFQDKCHYLSKMEGFYFSLGDEVNANAPKEDVFAQIDSALSSVLDKKSKLEYD